MTIVANHIRWIMLVSGVLTCTMAYAAVAPRAAMLSMFGEDVESMGEEIVVRNWSVLITLMGAMLIYGAFSVHARRLILTIAGASKLVFVVLMLFLGRTYLGGQLGIAVAIDALWVILFALYLLSTRSTSVASASSYD